MAKNSVRNTAGDRAGASADRGGPAIGVDADGAPAELELRPAGRRVVQQRKVRHDGWSRERRETFLSVLTQTCNVVQATRAAGMGASAPYHLRRRDPAFAELFREALALGYERLESALVAHALTRMDAIDVADLTDHAFDATGTTAEMPGVAPASGVTRDGIELALRLLKRHAPGATAGSKRNGPPALPTPEETDTLLLARLELLARKRARQALQVGS